MPISPLWIAVLITCALAILLGRRLVSRARVRVPHNRRSLDERAGQSHCGVERPIRRGRLSLVYVRDERSS